MTLVKINSCKAFILSLKLCLEIYYGGMAINNKLSFDNDWLIPDKDRCSCHLWMSFMRQTLLINHHCKVPYVTVLHAAI